LPGLHTEGGLPLKLRQNLSRLRRSRSSNGDRERGAGGQGFLRTLAYLGPDRWRFALLGLAVLTIVIPVTLVEPFLIRDATQMVLGNSGLPTLLLVLAMGIAYYGARVIMELLVNYVGLRLAYRVHIRVLRDSMSNFLAKDVSIVKSLPRGDVLYCFFNDSMRVAGFISSDLLGLFSNVVLLCAGFGLMLYFDAALAAPALAFMLMLSLLHIRLSRNLLKRQLAAKDIDQGLSGRAQNMLSGIVTLKGFRLLDPVLDRWMERYAPRWHLEIAIRMIEIALTSLATHGHIVFMFVILFFGLHRDDVLSASLAHVFAFLVVYNRIAAPFHYLVAFYLGLQETRAAVRRFYRLYDLNSGRRLDRQPAPALAQQDLFLETLETEGARTRRGGREILVPDMHFERGHTYLLEGPNGCGKTTAGLVLSGMLPLTAGGVRVNGSAASTQNGSVRIIYLEKEGYWPEGTIVGNLQLSDPSGRVDDERLDRCLRICQCGELVDSLPLGVNNPIATDWNLLSDGESQKLFLAFALYHRPALLVLDEALSHVPHSTRREILMNMRDAIPEMVVVLISHYSTDQELVDEVIAFPKGYNARPVSRGGYGGLGGGAAMTGSARPTAVGGL
jgi:ABC-type bacteriocin/lantibiotic exporter with double-glycine peptidase domain